MAKVTSLSDEALDALADMEEVPPDRTPRNRAKRPFYPALNKTQDAIFNDPKKFILGHGEKGCRTLDTMVYTATGLKRLGSMKPSGAVAGFNQINESVMSGPEEVSTADAYWVEDSRDAIRAVLSHGGEITGSPRHPIWVCRQNGSEIHHGWIRFEEMESMKLDGWRFWTPIIGHSKWAEEGPMDSRLAYAIGALVGDGALNFDTGDHRSVGFTNIDQECIELVKEGLSTIGATLSGGPLQYNVVPAGSIKPILREMGLTGLTKTKSIPSQIIESGKAACAMFLRGLFDTDGTVSTTGVVGLCTVSEQLGRDVQDLLSAFGILCVRRSRKSASGNPTWSLSIMGRHAYSFGKLIGFGVTRKQARISKPQVSLRNPHGFNSNRYGYPDPIRHTMKSIALESRTRSRTREWHNKHRHLHSFKSVPQQPKVEEFISIYGNKERLAPYLLSNTWVEIVRLDRTEAELGDLRVPGPHSFMASGTLNHNSGKSIGFLHKGVRHCYENANAFWLIIAPSIRTGVDGVVYDLENLVLPAWKDGNRASANILKDGVLIQNPNADTIIDDGMGLDYTEFKAEFDTKDRVMWIGNMHGGWSKVKIISIPYADAIAGRIKGPAPSMIYVEELTDFDDPRYFTLTAAQLGRRRGIKGPQQWCASCNPKGPKHWVFQHFFVENINKETGEMDPDYSVYHVPISENRLRIPIGYTEQLEKIFKADPISKRRLVDGEWIEVPTGEALLKGFFDSSRHVIGNEALGTGLKPHEGLTCLISCDLGQVNSVAVFQQAIPTESGLVWVVFDELVYKSRKILYKNMARDICDRILLWHNDIPKLKWEIVTGSDTLNQWRPGQGDYDATVFKKAIDAELVKNGLPPVPLYGAPNGEGSVAARTRLLQEAFSSDTMYISALCPQVVDAMTGTESDSKKPLHPKKDGSGNDHVFDALSYGLAKAYFSGRLFVTQAPQEQLVRISSF